jgi:hypothetical protein
MEKEEFSAIIFVVFCLVTIWLVLVQPSRTEYATKKSWCIAKGGIYIESKRDEYLCIWADNIKVLEPETDK